jgi:hypothetical protein
VRSITPENIVPADAAGGAGGGGIVWTVDCWLLVFVVVAGLQDCFLVFRF